MLDMRRKILSAAYEDAQAPGPHYLRVDGAFFFDEVATSFTSDKKGLKSSDRAGCVWRLDMSYPGKAPSTEMLLPTALYSSDLAVFAMAAQIDLILHPGFALSVWRSGPSLGHIATSPNCYAQLTNETRLAIAGYAISASGMREMAPLTLGSHGRSVKGAGIPRLVKDMADCSDKAYVDIPKQSKQADAVATQYAALSAVARQAAPEVENLWASVLHVSHHGEAQASLVRAVRL